MSTVSEHVPLVIQIPCPVAGVTVNVPAVIGSLIGIPCETATSGVKVGLEVGAISNLPKTTPLVISQGDLVYWSAGTSKITKTDTDTYYGACLEDAASGATTVRVIAHGAIISPDASDFITKALATAAHQILRSTASGAWAVSTIADESLIGRTAAGAVGGIAFGASTIAGRTAAGSLAALTPAEVRTILNPTTHTILGNVAGTAGEITSANAQQALIRGSGAIAWTTVGASRLLGRLAAGDLGPIQATAAEMAAGGMTADATGRGVFADGFWRVNELTPGAGGKFAAGAIAAASIAIFAANTFAAAQFTPGAGCLFAADCLVEAGLANLIANDAITAAVWEAKAAVGAISATADGRASLADAFYRTNEMGAGAGGKWVAGSFDAAAITHLFAANSLSIANVATVVQDLAIVTAKLDNLGVTTGKLADFGVTAPKAAQIDHIAAAGTAVGAPLLTYSVTVADGAGNTDYTGPGKCRIKQAFFKCSGIPVAGDLVELRTVAGVTIAGPTNIGVIAGGVSDVMIALNPTDNFDVGAAEPMRVVITEGGGGVTGGWMWVEFVNRA